MKIETILNAMTLTAYSQSDTFRELMKELPDLVYGLTRTDRQYRALRARIIKMDVQQREDIQELSTVLDMALDILEDQIEEIGEKDDRIAELDKENEQLEE